MTKEFAIGDAVFHPDHGAGRVVGVDALAPYPVVIDFEDCFSRFTRDGRELLCEEPTLRHAETLIAAKPYKPASDLNNFPKYAPSPPYQSETALKPTLRDQFAMVALRGIMADISSNSKSAWHQNIAANAYQMADAMMAERSKLND